MRDFERWRDRVELSLDGRQIFFLFVGASVSACLLFVSGVYVGRRLEQRNAPPVAGDDPLAALDQLDEEPDDGLTFHQALMGEEHLGGTSAKPKAGARGESGSPGTAPGSSQASPNMGDATHGHVDGSKPHTDAPKPHADAVPPGTPLALPGPGGVDQLLPHGPTPLPPIGHEAAPAPSPVPQAAVPTPAPHVASASDVRAEVHLSAPRPEPHAQAPKPAPKPSAKPETAAAGHLGGRYTLQLSSFTGEDEAAAFARKLRDDGLKPQVVASDIPGRGKFYRVRVGDYGSKQLADQARAEYDKKHRAPAIVTPM